MSLGDRLAAQLAKEADRRAEMGDHAVAHELRSDAGAVRRAQSALDASKRVTAGRR